MDEIDAFLRTRIQTDHEASSRVKATFLTLWDGLLSDPSKNVVVIGATNNIAGLDHAALRRMSVQFHIRLPTTSERLGILKLRLRELDTTMINLGHFARLTEGLSGSDLTEVCRGLVNDIFVYVPKSGLINYCSNRNRHSFIEMHTS